MPRKSKGQNTALTLTPPGSGIGGGGSVPGSEIVRGASSFGQALGDRLNSFTRGRAERAGVAEGNAALAEGRNPSSSGVLGFLQPGAFNDAALRTVSAGISQKAVTALDVAQTEAGGDIDLFEERQSDAIQKILADTPAEIREEMRASLSVKIEARRSQVLQTAIKIDRAEDETATRGVLDSALREVETYERKGNVEAAEASSLEYLGFLESAQSGPVPLFSPAQAAAFKDDLRFKREVNRALGKFEAQDTLEGQLKVMSDFKANPGDLSPLEADRVLDQMQRDINTQKAEIAETARIQRAGAVDDATMIASRLNAGLPVKDVDVDAVRRQLGRDGHVDLEMAVLEAQRGAATIASVARASAADQTEIINGLKASAQTPSEVLLIERAERVAAEQARLRDKDPMRAAVDVGLIEDVPPLEFTDPSAPQLSSVEIRSALADKVAKAWGIHPSQVSPFFASETEAIADIMKASPVDEQIATMTSVLDGAGPQRFLAFADQVSKANAPMQAIAAGVLSEHLGGEITHNIARGILLGEEAKAANPGGLDTPKNMDEVLNAYLGDAYEIDRGLQRDIMDAAVNLYAHRRGSTPGFDAEMLKQAAADITGGVVAWNDSRLVPPRGWDERQFARWMRTVDADYLEEMGGVRVTEAVGGIDRIVEMIADNGRLVTNGPGEYYVEVDSATQGRAFLRAANGERFVLRPLEGFTPDPAPQIQTAGSSIRGGIAGP